MGVPCMSGFLFSQEIVGIPWTGEKGIAKTTAQIMQQEVATAVPRSADYVRPSLEFDANREGVRPNPLSPNVSQWPPKSSSSTPPDHTFSVQSPQTLGLSFTTASLSDTRAFPPDDMGVVGPTQFVLAVNGRIRTFNKSTGVADGVLDIDTDTFFALVMSPQSGTFTTDPRIRYDRVTGRWFIIMIDVPAGTGSIPDRVMIAMSNTSTLTQSTVWSFFYFEHDLVSPPGDTGKFADYPTLGIDVNALYIGVNIFNSSGIFQGTTGFVVRKSSILGSGPIVVSAFRDLTTFADPPVDTLYTNGPYTPQGVDNFDTTATTGYFIGVDVNYYGMLDLRRVSNPGGTPTMSGTISITVPATLDPASVNHKGNSGGTNGKLDGIDERLMCAVIRNGNLWTSHSIDVTSSGTIDYNNLNNDTRDAARWYEINNLNGIPNLVQSGTVYDPTTPNNTNQLNYWIPSIMVSGQGHAAMGFAVAGTSAYANGATLGRLATDPLGTMEGSPVFVTSSNASYNPPGDPGSSGARRWGDYSYTSVDPNDDMTMWTIQQFTNATNSYGVRATKLLAPPPATPASASPNSLVGGTSNVNITITGTIISGSGFFDPGASFPNHISAAVNGGGVIVNSVTYTNPTHVTLNLSVANNATAGTRTITVTNPDSQSVTSSTGILTITSNCPTITFAPSTLPGGFTGTFYTQTITASGGKSPYTYSVLNGTLPNGLSLTSGGIFSGTPLNVGVANFKVGAIDSNGCFDSIAYSVNIDTLIPPSNPSAIGVAMPDTVSMGDSVSFLVTVRPGLNPMSSGITVNGNLSSISGSSSQIFFNDGTHGDAIAGDSIYSLKTIVDTGIVTGWKSIPIIITDAQLRRDSIAVQLKIRPPCQPITILPSQLSGGLVNSAYAETLSSAGGSGPLTYGISAGLLPTGISLSPTGILSGTPSVSGVKIFTVTGTDSNDCSGSRIDTIVVQEPSGILVNVPIGAQWNMLSNPLTVENDSAQILFPTKISNAFGYNGSGYFISNQIVNGAGYWMKFGADQTVPLIGTNKSVDTIPITSGWNLIGSISTKIPVTSLLPIGTTIRSQTFGYSSGYHPTDTIYPGLGYWIKCDSAGKCVLQNSGPIALLRSGKIQQTDLSSLNRLVLKDSKGFNQTLYFGSNGKIVSDSDLFALPPVPPDGNPDIRFASQRTAEFIPDHLQSKTDIPIELHSLNYPLTVEWMILKNGREQFHLQETANSSGGKELTGTGSMTVASSNTGSLLLRMEDVSQLPKAFALHQNYPNPFNPTTTISFDVPERSLVSISIYNTLGERVATVLNNAAFDQGEQTVEFNASAISSGIYFYRMTAIAQKGNGAAFTDVKKMLLLK